MWPWTRKRVLRPDPFSEVPVTSEGSREQSAQPQDGPRLFMQRSLDRGVKGIVDREIPDKSDHRERVHRDAVFAPRNRRLRPRKGVG